MNDERGGKRPAMSGNENEAAVGGGGGDLVKRERRGEEQAFINLQRIDLHGLVAIFDSYATKKTYAASFFNLALIANNFTELKQLIDLAGRERLGVTNIVVLMFVCISILLQVVSLVLI